MGIKLTKNWYQQQKENLEIVRKKTRSELQLQKTGLHPDFLFRSLNLINHQINTGSDNAAVLVLKLSDLLSYTLYKREIDLVPVEEELSALQNLILIEEKNDDSCFKIHLHIAFNDHDKFIAPMTILSLLYESLVMLKQGDSGYCIVTIRISSSFERLLVNFSFHLLSEIKSSPESWRVIIEASRRKLASSYNETDFQIQMAQNEQETLVVLNLPLINAIEAKPGMPDLKENRGIYEPA